MNIAHMSRILRGGVLFLLVISACTVKEDKALRGSCPEAGTALAAQIESPEILLKGPDAVGGAGDFLIRSRDATFIISGADREITYYHYGGIPVDAVPTKDCEQIAEEQFAEMALMLVKTDFDSFFHSDLRAFRADKVEIINDGSDGKAAHIRATGVDDYYWLIEYTLITEAYRAGEPRDLSQPFGIRWEVNYFLEPDSSVLEVQTRMINLGDNDIKLLPAVTMIMGNELDVHHYAELAIEFSGESFSTGIPWLTASGNGVGYGFGMPDSEMAGGNLHGVNASFNFKHIISPLSIYAGGEATGVTFLLSVAPKDGHSALAELQGPLGRPLPDKSLVTTPLDGSVTDRLSGKPVSGVAVYVEKENEEGIWRIVDSFITGPDGKIGPEAFSFDAPGDLRVRAVGDDRVAIDPVALKPTGGTVNLALNPAGSIVTTIKDATGKTLPAELTVYRDNHLEYRFFLSGSDTVAIAPGTWEYSLTRGYEYGTTHGTITVPQTGSAELKATLTRLVDTTGYLSADTHVHSAPSADSQVLLATRVRNSAAVGLEIPVATDHEAIIGLQSGIDETDLGDWVATVTGAEATASRPEHMTMFPVQPDGSIRGGTVKWYAMGPEEMNKAMYDRGAEIVLLNHPRGGGGLMSVIGWDRRTARPTLQDPTLLGWAEGTSLWSWNLNGFEYMNGVKEVFEVKGREKDTGFFDDWMSFLNHGHKLVAVGASDTHGLGDMGTPRTYFASSSDDVRDFSQKEMVAAFQKGDLVVSAGAFARVTANTKYHMGDLVKDSDGIVDLYLHIEAIPEIDITEFRVFANCDQVWRGSTTAPDGIVKFDGSLPITVTKDSHLVVLGFGQKSMPRGLNNYSPKNRPRFTTNAIYIDFDGNGKFDAPGDKNCSYDAP